MSFVRSEEKYSCIVNIKCWKSDKSAFGHKDKYDKSRSVQTYTSDKNLHYYFNLLYQIPSSVFTALCRVIFSLNSNSFQLSFSALLVLRCKLVS